MGTKVAFDWLKPIERIANETIGGDKTQLFLANEARAKMKPYVPELNHMLVKNVRVGVENGIGFVHYLEPYARFQWGGKVMVSSITGSTWSHGEAKILTNKSLSYSKVLATSHWEEAMSVAKKSELVKSVHDFIKGGFK